VKCLAAEGVLSQKAEIQAHVKGFEAQLQQRMESMEAQLKTTKQATIDENTSHQASLHSIQEDIGRVNRELADLREEHHAAITDVGNLTEYVAKAAATSIQRAEERFSRSEQELATKRFGAERSPVASFREIAKIAKEAQNPADAFDLGRSVGEKDAELRQKLMQRVESIVTELRVEAATQVTQTEDRIGGLETRLKTEMHQLSETFSFCSKRLDSTEAVTSKLSSRVMALEAGIRQNQSHNEGAMCTGNDTPSDLTTSAPSSAWHACEAENAKDDLSSMQTHPPAGLCASQSERLPPG